MNLYFTRKVQRRWQQSNRVLKRRTRHREGALATVAIYLSPTTYHLSPLLGYFRYFRYFRCFLIVQNGGLSGNTGYFVNVRALRCWDTCWHLHDLHDLHCFLIVQNCSLSANARFSCALL
jgi:hypothetical protein